ncbi:MAG: hypothetical protein A3C80_04385 [Candidatus Ryanbacteria bacterium RIFCSPHIGHO2_02_FULL_45_43]|uniref:Uncharacterized protein n=1 Tax=Candidatus Ryanbacteria bacterium RIFCSPHIGHO2_01_45_13 TaxID=1802112 RepID=A0A1G2FWL0_9BACT|nr:MAG: hypothetical protein A2W41_00500 [Candidatus Ryanbacteria bacterium RIFCSPHIGHO2_01_45_13]OGZ42620.1 MAG: hypothetical protein A2718_04285 [Candidatus Ryanbacteria bacterium RIFCSPHIGHO2_01_FULL_44_130]OGZ49114.1 MAG: hypothetical protein A3C80_04385 [Candidatus Ryanbacteria bacterium RIFCSPHIGHO2_02_FULL_45_43]OGZ50484.1 MAG: hypothetical protein A3E55_02050 [Candidatus Ryanbacteria bacterium RIFCSPHIGHO2_12_FULL_44_20]OGZ51373.1 MAG: hypothetical protein A3A17_00080 [Candidatus Ryanba
MYVVFIIVAVLLQVSAIMAGWLAIQYASIGVGLHPGVACVVAWAAGVSWTLITPWSRIAPGNDITE